MKTVLHSFSELAAVVGAKDFKSKVPQKEWADKQKQKVLRCPKCGATMQYINGTNVVRCETPILNKENKPLIDEKTGLQKICNFTKFLDNDGVSFMDYLSRAE